MVSDGSVYDAVYDAVDDTIYRATKKSGSFGWTASIAAREVRAVVAGAVRDAVDAEVWDVMDAAVELW
jgi:hypothetical protein